MIRARPLCLFALVAIAACGSHDAAPAPLGPSAPVAIATLAIGGWAIGVYGGRPFLLAEHLARFRFSATALALPPPRDVDELVTLVVGAAPPDHVLRL